MTIGPVKFQYSLMFMIFLFIGWLTVLFHSRDNFDQPTYELAANEPASIMVPRFFSSNNLYLRGFLIYLTGMTGIYVALSLAGEALVKGILAVFEDPTMNVTDQPASGNSIVVPSQWPLVLALAMVGLAPKITGLRAPELLLRRFSHRIALIPAYAKYLAFEMQEAPFDSRFSGDLKYPSFIHYRPVSGAAAAADQAWRKTCMIFNHVKGLADGVVVPRSGHPLDAGQRAPIQKEVQVFSSVLRDLDGKLQVATLSDEERADLETQLQQLLLRVYLLAACTIMAFEVRDIPTEMQEMGFAEIPATIPTLMPIMMVFGLLFFVLIIGNSTLAALGFQELVPPSFLLICLSTFYLVSSYGTATFTAITLYRRREHQGYWRNNPQWAGSFTAFFPIGVCAYVSSLLVLSIMLFPILAPQGLDKLVNFATFRSISPAVGALLACGWLKRNAFQWPSFVKFLATTSTTLAAIAGFASFLISALNNEPYPLPPIVFDAAQGLISGLAIGFLAEVTRAYLTKASIPSGLHRHQGALTPTTSGALEGVATTGGRIGF
ncbi:MAG: hypothetical protein JO282_14110 [Alphaproteobacteria bacterium]|nr:hypothetical protein [Alphaproteobacteria bacterium]